MGERQAITMKTTTTKKLLVAAAILAALGGGTLFLIHEVKAGAFVAPKAGADDSNPFQVDGDNIAVNADAIKSAAIELFPVEVT